MAQPLAKTDIDHVPHAASGIDEAAHRLERAFARLEGAAANARGSHHSLKADHGKLNQLLHDADGEIARLREVTSTVNARLDKVIATLEEAQ